MALSRLAAEFAAEITQQDWSDAPYRADRAGHQRWMDGNNPNIPGLSDGETDVLKLNIMWNTAQVLAHRDPQLQHLRVRRGVRYRAPAHLHRLRSQERWHHRGVAPGRRRLPPPWDLLLRPARAHHGLTEHEGRRAREGAATDRRGPAARQADQEVGRVVDLVRQAGAPRGSTYFPNADRKT